MTKPRPGRWTRITTAAIWMLILPVSFAWAPLAPAQDRVDFGSGQSPVVINQRAIDHIMERHWPDSPAPGAGKYAPGMTVDLLKQMVNQAVANGRVRHNTNGRPGEIYEYDFGHPIGIKINGKPAYRLRVVVNDRNQLVTAFPF